MLLHSDLVLPCASKKESKLYKMKPYYVQYIGLLTLCRCPSSPWSVFCVWWGGYWRFEGWTWSGCRVVAASTLPNALCLPYWRQTHRCQNWNLPPSLRHIHRTDGVGTPAHHLFLKKKSKFTTLCNLRCLSWLNINLCTRRVQKAWLILILPFPLSQFWRGSVTSKDSHLSFSWLVMKRETR